MDKREQIHNSIQLISSANSQIIPIIIIRHTRSMLLLVCEQQWLLALSLALVCMWPLQRNISREKRIFSVDVCVQFDGMRAFKRVTKYNEYYAILSYSSIGWRESLLWFGNENDENRFDPSFSTSFLRMPSLDQTHFFVVHFDLFGERWYSINRCRLIQWNRLNIFGLPN